MIENARCYGGITLITWATMAIGNPFTRQYARSLATSYFGDTGILFQVVAGYYDKK
jgi:hypothetical protein